MKPALFIKVTEIADILHENISFENYLWWFSDVNNNISPHEMSFQDVYKKCTRSEWSTLLLATVKRVCEFEMRTKLYKFVVIFI